MKSRRHEGRDEPILDPDLPIIDAHHHLFDLPGHRYLGEDYLDDAQAGHRIVASIYCETQSFKRQNGPEWLRPLGEVEFANGVGAMFASGLYGDSRPCAGIVAHADMTLGLQVGELLDRYMAAAPERLRGVRMVSLDFPDERPFRYIMTTRPPSGLFSHPEVPLAIAQLQKRGLALDVGIFHPSLPDVAALADCFPDLTVILNHMGTAVGIELDGAARAELFGHWHAGLQLVAQRPNVRCKIGGLGMPMWGFGLEQQEKASGYLDLAELWAPYVHAAIEAFGPERCMMESNFPPDSRSCGFVPLWNALKHVTKSYGAAERQSLFHDTALETYRLDLSL